MGAPPPIEMANIGMADTIILMILALVVFGPRRLPQIGRQIGKLLYEFRKASNDFKFQMEEELRQAEESDRRKKEEEARQKTMAAAPQVPQTEQSNANAAPPSPEPSATSSESPAASSNTGETTSPDAVGGTTQPIDTTAAAVETARLRIQPPSIGEIVATNRPGTPSNAPQPADQAAANDNASGANDAERSEPAVHHG